jgi:hypothetical protein
MRESKKRFNHEEVAEQYIAIYEEMLTRPLVDPELGDGPVSAPPVI